MSALPRNVEEARTVLLELGALQPDQLLSELEARLGFRPSAKFIQMVVDRYGDVFEVVDGRIGLHVEVSDQTPAEDDVPDVEWLNQVGHPPPLELSKAVVVGLVTSGFDSHKDHVLEIALLRLDGTTLLNLREPSSPIDATSAELLKTVLCEASALVCHRTRSLLVPFLKSLLGAPIEVEAPVLDVHQLSVLVDPVLTGRSLVELAQAFGAPLPEPRSALASAATIARLFNELRNRYDPAEPSWNLAWRLLAAGGSPWARVLPPPGALPPLDEVLVPKPDPLVEADARTRHSSAHHARLSGFKRLTSVPEFRTRAGQHAMAEAVATALDSDGRLLVEAPTGTGKSIAYLLPAIGRAGREPVVIATRTKVLQRQLQRDARLLRDLGVLDVPVRRIQGIDNYLCTREIAETVEAGGLSGADAVATAVAVRALATSDTGLWEDVTDVLLSRDDTSYKHRRRSLAATPATCERTRCRHVARCPLFTRLAGVDAQPGIIVANHALLATWAKDDESKDSADHERRRLVPFARSTKAHLIIDEAHDLEDTLTSAWTDSTGATDIAVQVAMLLAKHGPLRRLAEERAIRFTDLRQQLAEDLAFVAETRSEVGSSAAHYLREYSRGEEAALLPGLINSRPELRAFAGAVRRLARSLTRLRDSLRSLLHRPDDTAPSWSPAERRLAGTISDLNERIDLLFTVPELPDQHRFLYVLGLEDPGDDETAPEERWTFRRMPVEVGPRFRATIVDRANSTVLTSATLRVDGSFDFLAGRLGLSLRDDPDDADRTKFHTLVVQSPFDHDRQSAVVLTSHLALPVPGSEAQFCEDLADDQIGFLSLTGGRTLGLFAARTRMEAVAERVRRYEEALSERGVRLLVQGEEAPATIERRFREDPGTVVYGLRSYWEGFDAPGETLSYLMIEKPPYPHPNDVVHQARQRQIAERGGDPFRDYVVPRTAIVLAQGFGRLVRTEDDRGAAIIADRRMQLPTAANATLLRTLPTSNLLFTTSREEAWRAAIEFVTGEEPDLANAILVGVADVDRLLEELRIRPGDDVEAKLRRAANELFDIDELRDEQLTLMLALLNGQDVLGFLPTGFGKSICFQLPALLQPDARATVVVSPLVALIKDQVDELRSRRRLREVVGITGRTTRAEQIEILRDLAEGRVRLLYVSPERLVRDPTLHAALRQVDLNGLVVDEAHCISSWGHDFRPEFRQIARSVLELRRSPRLGFTATATPHVERDIERTLDMNQPVVVRRSVDRPDLYFAVRKFTNEHDRVREMFRFVLAQDDTPGIIYASRRALTEELAWYLRQMGMTARSYHAGMLPEQREAVQDDFLTGTTQVIVATKAFGMGVNKPDIHWVLHYDVPESLEGYAQEAGRAARAPDIVGDCALFYTARDSRVRDAQVAGWDVHEQEALATQLLEEVAASPVRGEDHLIDSESVAETLDVEEDQLNVLVAWLEQIGCLERKLDAAVRGHVTIGYQEPDEPDEKRKFFNLLKRDLRCRLGVRRFVELDELAQTAGITADELDQTLTDWSLRRLVTYLVTRRRWRIQILRDDIPRRELARIVDDWTRLQRDRLRSMASYARSTSCRRALIAVQFGDPAMTCADTGGRPCDVCSGTPPPWHRVPMARVPHPDDLVDVPLIVLQAVHWTSQRRGTYGEKGLRAAICGKETIGEHRISPGLLWCPQFGALRYLKTNERRLDEAIAKLIADDSIRRVRVEQSGRSYDTLLPTERGLMRLGALHG